MSLCIVWRIMSPGICAWILEVTFYLHITWVKLGLWNREQCQYICVLVEYILVCLCVCVCKESMS